MKRFIAVALAAPILAAAPAAAAPKPVTPPGRAAWVTVKPVVFGMHAGNLSVGTTMPGRVGAVRLWDNGVRWDQVETARDEYDWQRLDTAVETARRNGVKDITYVLGSTPKWAASHVRPDVYYYGGGTASEPTDLADWRDWVRDVARRYKGKITSYQIWNEANLSSFWAAERPKHWVRMAILTEIAAKQLRRVDPDARVVAASSTVIQGKRFARESFFYRYMRSLKKRKVDFDVISVHLYPWTTAGPGGGTPTERLVGLEMANEVLDTLGMQNKPIWDTEVNYGNRRDNGHPREVFTATQGAAFLARTYIDSLRYGVTRVFWYSWDSHVMGISTVDEQDADKVLKPGKAFFVLQDWLRGARFGTCSDQRVTVCSLKRQGERQYLLYAGIGDRKRVTVPRPVFGVRKQCTLDGVCERIAANRVIKVTQAPVLLTS